MQAINEYMDYREWLKDTYHYQKEKNIFWSYRWFASKISMDAGNLVKVIQKERHLPKKSIAPLCDILQLTEHESEYLEALYNFNKARTPQKSKELFEILMDKKYLKLQTLESFQYQYYNEWQHSVILACLTLYPYKGNVKELASRIDPPIKEEDVRDSILLLEKLKLIKKNKSGVYVVNHRMISSGSDMKAWAIHQFQKEMLYKAERSLKEHKSDERDFSTLTITAGEKDLLKIKEITKEYRRKVLDVISDSEEQDRVMQLNIQFFPLSTKIGEGKK